MHVFFYMLRTTISIKKYIYVLCINQNNVNSREEENRSISELSCSVIFLCSIIIFSTCLCVLVINIQTRRNCTLDSAVAEISKLDSAVGFGELEAST